MAALQRSLDSRGTGVLAKEQMARCDFKLQIAECLSIQAAKPEARKQGIQIVELKVKKRRGSALTLPAKAIMMNANDHWIVGRCRFAGCKECSHVICSKCSTSDIKVALCLNQQRSCYIRFHTE